MILPGMLELLRERPNWLGALSVALTRPPGTPERRTGEDPWKTTDALTRPRRITDEPKAEFAGADCSPYYRAHG